MDQMRDIWKPADRRPYIVARIHPTRMKGITISANT